MHKIKMIKSDSPATKRAIIIKFEVATKLKTLPRETPDSID